MDQLLKLRSEVQALLEIQYEAHKGASLYGVRHVEGAMVALQAVVALIDKAIEAEVDKQVLPPLPGPIVPKLTVNQTALLRRIGLRENNGLLTYWELTRGERRIATTLQHMRLITEANREHRVGLVLTETGKLAVGNEQR